MDGRSTRSLYRWDMRRAQKVNSKQQAQLQAEARECPFTPKVGGMSRRIAYDYAEGGAVHQRLASDANRRHIEFTQEQEVLRKLKPKHFAKPQKKASPPPKPKSPGRGRPASAPAARALPGQDGQGQRARSNLEDGGARGRSAAPRASMAVLTSTRIGYESKGGRRKKGQQLNRSDSAGGSTLHRPSRKSRWSVSVDRVSQPPPKTVMTGGVNVVKFNARHAELLNLVREGPDGV